MDPACLIIGILLCGRHPYIASRLEIERSAYGVTSVGAEVMICRPTDKNLVLLPSGPVLVASFST